MSNIGESVFDRREILERLVEVEIKMTLEGMLWVWELYMAIASGSATQDQQPSSPAPDEIETPQARSLRRSALRGR